MSENTNTAGQLAYDPHWGTRKPGEVAELIGAGDPNEIVAGPTPVAHEELDK
jgi:hypothetical protein